MNLGVTVVVCTHNNAALLPETIQHLAQQRVDSNIPWEVIIVDNASSDGTTKRALDEWKKHSNNTPFSIFNQPKQGKLYAIELAFRKAKFEYVIICDDDNWLNPNYVNIAYKVMSQRSSIGVLGGHGEVLYETAPPMWVIKLSLFGNGPQSATSGKVSRNIVYGAGCVIRKSAYESIYKNGSEPMLIGREGKKLSSGEDYELCYNMVLAGYSIWYEETLKFIHFMPEHRLTWDYHVRFFKESARSNEVLIPYQAVLNWGCQNLFEFNIRLIRLLAFYAKTFAKLILSLIREKLKSNADDEKIITLKIIALKARVLIFKEYIAMIKNFKTILRYKSIHSGSSSRFTSISKVVHASR